MKVLMFGWEFPPNSIGGLGRVCFNIVKNLSQRDVDVVFVAPRGKPDSRFGKVISLDNKHVKIRRVNSILVGYMTSQQYAGKVLNQGKKKSSIYGKDLFEEVERYTKKASEVIANERYDVIHAHDWMTFKAGVAAKKHSGKPLVMHVHSTEFDRSGGNVNQFVYNIEREGLWYADSIITVSNYMKENIVKNYGVDPAKINVVHNGVGFEDLAEFSGIKNHRTVLFFGRVTLQKGPDYFLYAAKKVLEQKENVKFIIAGSGDMEARLIEKAAEMGISDNVLFTGFLKENDVNRIYQMSDIYVLPSVSEPFGITVLEAMKNGVPVIVSKNSGVIEVVKHCLKADFWDINEMSDKIIALLNYNILHDHIKQNGINEVRGMGWNKPVEKCIEIYNGLIGAS